MSRKSIWDVLGITATRERGEIRRAYAARLKLTHPEDDPEGFRALREAYEIALNYAAQDWSWEEAEAETDDGQLSEAATVIVSDEIGRPAEIMAHAGAVAELERPAATPAADPAEAARQQALSEHAAACNALGELLSEGAEPERLRAALERVLGSPAMESVSIHGDTELWLARCIAYRPRQADVLVQPAVRHFGWDRRQNAWDLPHEVAAVLVRLEDLDTLDRLKKRTYLHHDAYHALTQSPSQLGLVQRMRLGRHAKRVGAFLRFLNRERPALLDDLDQEALAWWTKHLKRKHFPWRTVIGWSLPILFIIAVAVFGGSEPPAPRYGPAPQPTIDQLADRAVTHPDDAANLVELCKQRARGSLQLDQAAAGCDAAVEKAPESLSALDGRALMRMRDWKMKDAVVDYDAILKVSPNNVRALYGRGLSRMWLQDQTGRDDIAKALAIDPRVMDVWRDYGFQAPYTAAPYSTKTVTPPAAMPPVEKIIVRAGAVVTPPSVEREPTEAESASVYPAAADSAGPRAGVVMKCKVALDGTLNRCIVWSETPPDLGLAEAALKLSAFYRATPLTVDGKPDPRGTMTLELGFKPGT